MKHIQIGFLALFLGLTFQSFAQKGGENLVGKWQTEDKTIVEIMKLGTAFTIKQVSTIKEKEKGNNGKIIGKELVLSTINEYKGIVIDLSNKKEYKALFTMAKDGKTLELKVKWGILNFNETWKKL